MAVGLSRIAVRLPRRTEPVADVLARTGHGPLERKVFTRIYGLRDTPTLAPDERMADLLVEAGTAALDGGQAQLVLYGHTMLTQEFQLDGGFADRLRAGLGLPDAELYGVSHVNCVSVLRSLELAHRYLRRPTATQEDRVLVIGGDQASVHEASRVIPAMAVGGDGAVGVVARRGAGRYRYLGGATLRDVRFHRNLQLSRDDSRLFGEVCQRGAVEVVTRAALAAGLSTGDIDWVMPHLSNRMFWRTFSAGTGIPADRICLDLIAERGHNFGGDALMALEHADRAGQLRPGDRCALVSLALGAYFQATLVEVQEDSR
ncbi:3-oxoacyl-[acyl-carrier-protein] synthase III C-terminal domain-containing protein [Streptomyces sp. DSM 44915]|uniref:3-oxoacyl-[acyl-carrier-protein] synthase III C-terminal domain-containing protein n=1 Tax=Streptomyces chisholmiae TaxID=3075540 RepID=A0ABU2JQW3_9ACTN|nr:3-oxoacyl-[acyl-carrier-protein] synthase III C-terminal domain-containing protein [Streptomyces sp. DSM 44915]MDT0267372.1 3-oxoacyl-[acyl-carrier-protein] synthase III C-terminal domain-containing protein [Streptomyces sp. DSM 44915]